MKDFCDMLASVRSAGLRFALMRKSPECRRSGRAKSILTVGLFVWGICVAGILLHYRNLTVSPSPTTSPSGAAARTVASNPNAPREAVSPNRSGEPSLSGSPSPSELIAALPTSASIGESIDSTRHTREFQLVAHDQDASDSSAQINRLELLSEQTVDQWLISLSYRAAWEHVSIYANSPLQQIQSGVLHRLGIAASGVGENDAAVRAFQAVLQRPGAPTRLRVASQIELCRTWMAMNRFDLAIPSLSQIVLDPQFADHKPTVRHLLAVSLACRVIGVDENLLTDSLPYSNPKIIPAADERLQILSAKQQQSFAGSSDVRLLFGRELGVAAIELAVDLPSASALTSISRIAEVCDLNLDISDVAVTSLNAQQLRIASRSESLALVLDSIVEGVGLHWSFEGRTIRIRGVAEVSDEDLDQYARSIANRALRRATIAYSGDGYQIESLGLLGDLAYQNGTLPKAITWYDKVLEMSPRSPHIARIKLNYAKIRGQQGSRAAAEEDAFMVVDMPSSDRLTAAAYVLIGRWRLEKEEARTALRPLQRAIGLTRDSTIRGIAAPLLAIAFSLDENPHAASAVLQEHRDVLLQSDVAAFLTAMARVQASQHDSSSLSARRHMLTAVNRIRPNQFYGEIGHVLIANAYAELGLHAQMISAYENALASQVPANLANRMVLDLARHHMKTGNFRRVRETIAKLSGEMTSPVIRQGEFLLAKIDLEQRRVNDCRKRCMAVLDFCETDEERAQVLKYIGQTYEAESQHYKAALCYAGMLPDSSSRE